MAEEIFYTFLDSFLGKIGIASSPSGIVCVDIGTGEDAFSEMLKRKFVDTPIKSEKKNSQALNRDFSGSGQAIDELNSYLKGNLKEFDSKLDIRGTPFRLNVWNNTRKIPYGGMRSYKFIACEVAKATYSRAVGNAISKNPIPIFIPCHRVINSDGNLGRYGPGENIKRRLLELEGAI